MNCDVCKIMAANNDIVVFEGVFWRVALSYDQEYIGRSFISLREHKSSLSELTDEEWLEFAKISKLLEVTVTKSFAPTHFNWLCLMNGALQLSQSTHVHWHMIPRYNVTVEFDGTSYKDPTWPDKYEHVKPIIISQNKLEKIKNELIRHIG